MSKGSMPMGYEPHFLGAIRFVAHGSVKALVLTAEGSRSFSGYGSKVDLPKDVTLEDAVVTFMRGVDKEIAAKAEGMGLKIYTGLVTAGMVLKTPPGAFVCLYAVEDGAGVLCNCLDRSPTSVSSLRGFVDVVADPKLLQQLILIADQPS